MPHQLNEVIKAEVARIKAALRIVDDAAKPLTGSDITGRHQHQYVRLAVVGYKPPRAQERYFAVFMESDFLHQQVHKHLQSTEVEMEFDPKWVFIEEVIRKPTATDTMDGYLKMIEFTETALWVAIFEHVITSGVATERLRSYLSNTVIL